MRLLLLSALLICGCSSLSQNKERAAMHLQLGASLYQSGNNPQALVELLKAEKLDPDNPMTQNNLGLVYWARGKFELSEKHIKKAIQIAPDFTDARNNLARVYVEQKKFSEAQLEMSRVLADLTYSALDKAYFNQGLIFFEQGKMENAEKFFRQSVDAQKENCFAMDYLGRTFFERKLYEQASSYLDRAISICRKTFYDEPHYYSALSYFRMGQREKAQARFEELIKNYPDGQYVEKSRAMLQLIRKNEI